MGQTVRAIVDDQLGIFGFKFYFIFQKLIRFCLIFQQKRFSGGYLHLTAPGIVMKQMKNIKLVAAPGFLMEGNSLSGKQILGSFGSREKVTFSICYLNSSIKWFCSWMW